MKALYKILIAGFILLKTQSSIAQYFSDAYINSEIKELQDYPEQTWKNIYYGGSVEVGFGRGFSNISLVPSVLYQLNPQFGVGFGLQYNYYAVKNSFTNKSYGTNVLLTYNPISEIQLSAEIEQLYVRSSYKNSYKSFTQTNTSFWNTAFFLGVGYSNSGITVGLRYNILHNKSSQLVYSEAWMPFVRLYF